MTGEQRLNVSFDVARARLAGFAREPSLVAASRQAYSERVSGLTGIGFGSALAASKLVRVACMDVVNHGTGAVLVLRWEAADPDGTLFPVLDADLTLEPSGRNASILTMNGAWRPRSADAYLDRADLQQAGTAAIKMFVRLVAEDIARPSTGKRAPGQARRPPVARVATALS